MVSGIGPKATLEKFAIPVVAAREGVGQNMWDQPSFSMFQQTTVETLSGLSDPSKAAAAALLYDANRTGILTSNSADYFGKPASIMFRSYFRKHAFIHGLLVRSPKIMNLSHLIYLQSYGCGVVK